MSAHSRINADHTRTVESWEKHNDKIAACGEVFNKYVRRTGLFVDTVLIPSNCNSNYCEKCRIINISRIRNMLYNSLQDHDELWRFLTLTFDPKKKNITEQYKEVSLIWDRFRKRLFREVGESKWIRTVELQGSGNMHIHSIINKYIDKDLIIKHWTDLGGGGITIGLNPVCKNHRVKCCAVCYPSQWLHKTLCIHNKINCTDCFEYLNNCKIHGKRSCGVCYPSNIFDRRKCAADYLTVELIKSKMHQDPYKTGLEWWLARRRSIAMSRNIKLKKKNDNVQYSYIGRAGNHYEVDQYLKFIADDNTKAVTVEGSSYVISEVI